MEYGWALPKREEYFRDAKQEATETFRIHFQGEQHVLKQFSVPITLPKYRLKNGRTVSLQAEWLANNIDKPKNYFRNDPESDEVQISQHQLLTKLISGQGLKAKFENPTIKQDEPLFLDSHGFVVNGNRRLCCWRELYNNDALKYEHFSHIRIIVLPPAEDKAIDKLEAELQVAQDIREEYTWDTLANMMYERSDLHEYSIDQLADLYDKKPREIQELFDMRKYAEAYLISRGLPDQWSKVSGHEYAFQEIVRGRKKVEGVERKRIFEEISFTLIDKPNDAGGRLYNVIKQTATLMPEISRRMKEEIEIADPMPTESNSEGIDSDPSSFFSEDASTDNSVEASIAESICDGQNSSTVRDIVKDAMADAKAQEENDKKATFVRKRLQRANTEIQNALNGITEESEKNGIKEQIDSIESGLTEIKGWLNNDA